jgi:Prolipoprotein diacylglyceryl transferase
VLLWADRRFRLGYGRVFALYVMLYTLGRGWIEYLRIDPVELQDVGGLRFNVWTSIVLFVLATAYFVVTTRRHPRPDSRELTPYASRDQAADPETDPETETETETDAENDAENSPEDRPERDPDGASFRSEDTETAELSGPDAARPRKSSPE